jgi:hypothetical protein
LVRGVVRRSALDTSWDIALADFPPELHPHIPRYYEARRAEQQARGALTVAKARHRIDSWKTDRRCKGSEGSPLRRTDSP